MKNKAAAISKTMELPGDKFPRLGESIFDFAETMVNLKSWAIAIFVLNSHIPCQTLKHLKEKKSKLTKTKTPVSCLILTHMYPFFRELSVNTHDHGGH